MSATPTPAPAPASDDSRRVVLAVDDIHTYYGNIEALKGISIKVNEGECAIPISATSWPGMFWISRPLNTIRPDRGGTIPEIERSVVDFPAPLEPIRVTISPSRTSREMPLSAWIEP